MALDFPNSPTLNQQYTHPTTGIIWVYDGAKWVSGTSAAAYAPIASPVFTGNPQAPNPPAGDADTSVATTSFVAAAVATTQGNVGRNLVQNSLYRVAQRGFGPWSVPGYTLDRWALFFANDTATVQVITANDAARAQVGDESLIRFLQINFAGSAVGGSYTQLIQRIESVQRISGKPVTVSFWANASAAGLKLNIFLYQDFGTGGSPSGPAFTANVPVTLTTTLTRYTATFAIPSAAGKTFGTNGNDWTQLSFTLSDPASAIGVQSGSISIWGVQLEIGSVATPLEKPDPPVELANCQRFYTAFNVITICPVNTSLNGWVSSINYPVTMRTTPTLAATHGGGTVSRGVTFAYQTVYGTGYYMSGTGVIGDFEIATVTANADL